MGFLERVATEFAVAVEGFLARQAAVRERDRLRTLFDITNALVSKLSPDELFSAISDQPSKVIRHDHAVITPRSEESGVLDVYALHSADLQLSEAVQGPFDPVGMPAAEVLATGKPVVARDVDIDRYPNPNFRRFVALGLKSICSVSLITRDHHRNVGALSNDGGCLDFGRRRIPGSGREPDRHRRRELARLTGVIGNEGAARYGKALPGRRDPAGPQHWEHGRTRAGFSIHLPAEVALRLFQYVSREFVQQ